MTLILYVVSLIFCKMAYTNKLATILRHFVPVFVTQSLNVYFRTSYSFAASFDITYKCPLKCKHCYFIRQGYNKELSDEEWVKIFHKLRKKGVLVAIWVGGEPLLRKDLVRKGVEIFPFNWLITNGTLPIPNWEKVVVWISVDGTKPYYEKIRGPVYDKVKSNILSSPVAFRLAIVINKLNLECIEDLILEWVEYEKCIGINFDLYTPSIGEKGDLVLGNKDISNILQKLLKARNKYGDKIMVTKRMIDLHKVKNRSKVIGKNCLVRNVISLDPLGRRKRPCVIVGADCNRCGCTIPYLFTSALKYYDIPTYKMFLTHCL